MIISELNIILGYIINSPEESIDFSWVFDDGIKEEYFWRTVKGNNRSVLEDILEYDDSIFRSKLNSLLVEGGYNNNTHFSIRFLYNYAQEINEITPELKLIVSNMDEFIDKTRNIDLTNVRGTWFISEIITVLPLELITVGHVNFLASKSLINDSNLVSYSVENRLLPRIINAKNKELAMAIIDKVLFNYVLNESSDKGKIPDESYSIFDSHSFSSIIDSGKIEQLAEFISPDELTLSALNTLKRLSKLKPFECSSFHIPSIEDSDQLWNKNSFSLLTVRFIRNILDSSKVNKEFVESKLLQSDHAILNRIGIHSIGTHYNQLSELFWKWSDGNPLDKTEMKHEIFTLLQRNKKELSDNEINILFFWIDTMHIEPWSEENTKEDLEHQRSLIGKEYLDALANSESSISQRVARKRNELDEIYPHRRENPGWNSHFSISSGYYYPDDTATFIEHLKDTRTFVDYIEGQELEISSREYQGQLERIRKAFIENPHFIKDVDAMSKLGTMYLPDVYYGLEKAFENGKDIDWESAFKLSRNALYKKPWDSSGRNKRAFVGSLAWLIRTGVKQDSRDFSEKNLIDAKNLCIELLDLRIESQRFNNDPFFDILNSPEGKVLEATINVSLRYGRIYKSDSKDKWFPDLKEYYSNIFIKEEYNDAFIHHIGSYLPQIAYLDIEWVKSNINYLFPKQDEENWILAMSSYVKRNRTVYKDIFNILLTEGHYQFGIIVMRNGQSGLNEFVQQIVISAIANWEGQTLNDKGSLINLLFDKGSPEQINAVISYLFVESTEKTKYILPFWKKILESNTRLEDQGVLKNTLKLIHRIKHIDESYYEVISNTLRKIKDKTEMNDALRYLVKFEGDDYEYRAKLIMEATSDNLDYYYISRELDKLLIKLMTQESKIAIDFANNLVSKRAFSLISTYRNFNGN
ncbi:hypothetical protein [Leeuwenhoekiella parthenopeia]|uniref:Uncharacterized protein n=1 Tax=Leeuwenhoekiella parthenopeia TaxID=2890320 RepID=A0ABS8GSS3_9FLAO|nr:hypothetical protein [Leeuwenhoekiella parthenopeia]MCC4212710.1 hypothetical protein [Leeuwenhoekiella parthenopeia]